MIFHLRCRKTICFFSLEKFWILDNTSECAIFLYLIGSQIKWENSPRWYFIHGKINIILRESFEFSWQLRLCNPDPEIVLSVVTKYFCFITDDRGLGPGHQGRGILILFCRQNCYVYYMCSSDYFPQGRRLLCASPILGTTSFESRSTFLCHWVGLDWGCEWDYGHRIAMNLKPLFFVAFQPNANKSQTTFFVEKCVNNLSVSCFLIRLKQGPTLYLTYILLKSCLV